MFWKYLSVKLCFRAIICSFVWKAREDVESIFRVGDDCDFFKTEIHQPVNAKNISWKNSTSNKSLSAALKWRRKILSPNPRLHLPRLVKSLQNGRYLDTRLKFVFRRYEDISRQHGRNQSDAAFHCNEIFIFYERKLTQC